MSQKLYTRAEAAQYLQGKGVTVAIASLAKYFSVGGGPELIHFGRKPLYPADKLDEWVASKLTAPRRSSSEPARLQANAEA